MKAFVQFLQEKWNYSSVIGWRPIAGQFQPCIGSDGIFILDARNCLAIQIQDARERARRLSRITGFIGFEIHHGDLKNSQMIYREIFS